MNTARLDDATRARHERDLLALTGLPTAAGREGRVVAWVGSWVKRRRNVTMKRDRHGNLLLQGEGVTGRRPLVFTAHLDHPAFVVTAVEGGTVEAEFRGGVQLSYFKDAAVRLWHRDRPPQVGRVVEAREAPPRGFKVATVEFAEALVAEAGDVMTWDLEPSAIRDERLHAPACDDLAAVAAALGAFGALTKASHEGGRPDVRLLLTRAEEVGFIGAIGACGSGLIPKAARLIALENSKSFAESPLGGGPIVRVGDATSTFDPALTHAVGQVAQRLAASDDTFRWQRKLMPGGTCEASAYQALGYTATCVCLPLANYHNMNEDTGRIDAESIHLADYHGLIRLLIALGRGLDDPDATPPLADRLRTLFDERQHVLT